MSLSEIVDGFAATITTKSDVRCYSDPSSFSPPCVLVDVPESLDLQVAYGSARQDYIFPLLFVVNNKNPRSARSEIEAMIDTVNLVLFDNEDLGGVCESAAAINVVQWQIQDIQDVNSLTCVMRVGVLR